MTLEAYLDSLPRHGGGIDLRRFRETGAGGTHDVFALEDDDPFVLKIDRATLARARQLSGLSAETERAICERIASLQREHENVIAAFGPDHCLAEHYCLEKVFSEQDDAAISTIVLIQEKSDAFQNPARVSLAFTHVDKQAHAIDAADYERLIAIATGGACDMATLLRYEPQFKEIFDRADSDSGFRDALAAFMEGFRAYYQRHARTLDFVGTENVLFYPAADGWTFQLGTVFKGDATLAEFEAVLATLKEGAATLEDEYARNAVNNMLANARGINALACKLGLTPVFKLVIPSDALGILKAQNHP